MDIYVLWMNLKVTTDKLRNKCRIEWTVEVETQSSRNGNTDETPKKTISDQNICFFH